MSRYFQRTSNRRYCFTSEIPKYFKYQRNMYLCPSTNTTIRVVSNDLGIRVVQTPRVIHYRKTRADFFRS